LATDLVGQVEPAEAGFAARSAIQARLQPPAPSTLPALFTMRMRRRRFEALVGEALDSLPPDLLAMLDNVELVVEDWPSDEDLRTAGVAPDETLYGLYLGVPLTQRGGGYSMALPDKIIIFQGPIEDGCRTYAELVAQVRTTVIHEVAHHFGISDARLDELGWA
jgi:predicted Zn-dependent protease with MMP-like domain